MNNSELLIWMHFCIVALENIHKRYGYMNERYLLFLQTLFLINILHMKNTMKKHVKTRILELQ